MNNEKIGVIADDLTGCGDVGVLLVKYGLNIVTTVSDVLPSIEAVHQYDVIMINTDTRHESPDTAYSRVAKAAEYFRKLNIKKIYKKIDSTLRGNIGSEIDALFDVFKLQYLDMCAAFPKAGRTTNRGYHYVNKKLITDTEFASDPQCPVREAYIPALLKNQTSHNEQIRVYDCVDQRDLKQTAKKITDLLKNSTYQVICGASGLIEELTDYWYKPHKLRKSSHVVKAKNVENELPVLIVSGSAQEISHEQIENTCKSRDVICVKINFEMIEYNDIINKCVKALNSGYSVIIYPERRRINSPENVINILRKITKIILEHINIQRFILIGGETANAVCRALGIKFLEIAGSVCIGIPFCRTPDDKYRIILKPGGFGHSHVIEDSLRYMKEKNI